MKAELEVETCLPSNKLRAKNFSFPLITILKPLICPALLQVCREKPMNRFSGFRNAVDK